MRMYWFGIKLATVKPFKYEKSKQNGKEKGRFRNHIACISSLSAVFWMRQRKSRRLVELREFRSYGEQRMANVI